MTCTHGGGLAGAGVGDASTYTGSSANEKEPPIYIRI